MVSVDEGRRKARVKTRIPGSGSPDGDYADEALSGSSKLRATELELKGAELIQSKRASRSVLNACHALVVLMEAGEPLALGEFAQRAKLAPATAHRILRSLALYQFVRQNDDGGYELGFRLLELGSAVASQFDIVRMARPHMERLAETTGETVHLAVLDDDHAVYVDKVEGRHSIRLVSRPGYTVPLHATSLGKVLCAGLNDSALEALLERLSRSLDDNALKRFRAEIDEARRTGYAVDREELLPGLMCVGTPVFDRDGSVLAAMSVAGPTFRMEGPLQQYAGVLADAVSELSSELGYSGPRLGATGRR
jgi:IclR family transcriptional regulator, KDG regulon repressor